MDWILSGPSSTCAASSVTSDSRRLSRFSSSACFSVGDFQVVGSRRRGTRPVTGKWHSIRFLAQLEQGFLLSHLTLRCRHVTQLHICKPSTVMAFPPAVERSVDMIVAEEGFMQAQPAQADDHNAIYSIRVQEENLSRTN